MPAFQTSPLAFGAINPDAITAVSDLLAAGTGAGIAIGGAVQRKRQRKAAEAARRRRRRRPAPAAPAPLPAPYPEPAPLPSWLLPVGLVGLLGVGGFLWWQSQKGKD